MGKKPALGATVVVFSMTLLQILSQPVPARAIDYQLTDAQVKEAVALGKKFPWTYWSPDRANEWVLKRPGCPTIQFDTPFSNLASFASYAPLVGHELTDKDISLYRHKDYFDIEVYLFSLRSPEDNANVYVFLIQDGKKIRATAGGSNGNVTHNDILHGQKIVWYGRVGGWSFAFKDFDYKRPFTIRVNNYVFGFVPGNADYVIDPSKIR